MYLKVARDIVSFLLILLFSYAAVSKLLQYTTFTFQLRQSPFLSDYADIIVWLLPFSELLAVLLLLLKPTKILGMYFSFGLMFAFTIYIYAVLHFSPFVPCTCGGLLSQMSWEQHFIFNIVFTLLALTGIFTVKKTPQP